MEFINPTPWAESVERISAAQNGMIILVLIVIAVFGLGVLGILGLLVRSHTATRKRQLDLDEQRQKQDAEREKRNHELMTGMKATFDRVAQVQETAEVKRTANDKVVASIVEALGEMMFMFTTFRKQQAVNVETLQRLEQNQTGFQATFEDTVRAFTGKLDSATQLLVDFIRESTARGFVNIEATLQLINGIRTDVIDVKQTVHAIQKKVETQELPAVTAPANEPKGDA